MKIMKTYCLNETYDWIFNYIKQRNYILPSSQIFKNFDFTFDFLLFDRL